MSDEEAKAGESTAGSDDTKEKSSDDEWKRKVAEEKAKLDERPTPEEAQLPPASFLGLVQELAFRAMIALGQIPNPATGEPAADLQMARYTIDLLEMLEAKTKENLDTSESATLTDLLHNLRIAFVNVAKDGVPEASTGDKKSGEGSSEPKIIV